MHKLEVVETPVKFHSDETLKGVSRYTVSVYAKGQDKAMATLDVAPVALPAAAGPPVLITVGRKPRCDAS